MDAHYFKVMEAREAIKDTGKRLYFAYSGVLDQEAFLIWREQHSYTFFDLPRPKVAEVLDMEMVFDFPSRWWGGRVAGLVPKTGASVFGLLFEVEAKNWPVIQHKEGFITSMAVEKEVTVRVDGIECKATCFVTNPQRASMDGAISGRYLEAIVRGAEKSGLPASYIEKLKAIQL